MNTDSMIAALAARLTALGWRLVTAESCTGGMIAARLTDLPGSSAWFDRAFVTYSNQAKQQMLSVSPRTLNAHGAVSEAVAQEMAAGALRASGMRVALSVSGIAGPTGGSSEKPVGTVCFAWAIARDDGRAPWIEVERQRFFGPRALVREQASAFALRGMLERL